MPEPFRLKVLKNLCTLLETVNPSNGYEYDLRNCVFRGRLYFGDSDPLPLVSILELPIPEDMLASPDRAAYATGPWGLLVQGFVKDDPNNPTDPAHYLMAEVKKALALERKQNMGRGESNILGMNGKVTDLMIGTGTVRPPDDTSAYAYFYLTLDLKIVEDNADPYV